MKFDFKTRRDRMEQFRSIKRTGGNRHTLILLAVTLIAFALLVA